MQYSTNFNGIDHHTKLTLGSTQTKKRNGKTIILSVIVTEINSNNYLVMILRLCASCPMWLSATNDNIDYRSNISLANCVDACKQLGSRTKNHLWSSGEERGRHTPTTDTSPTMNMSITNVCLRGVCVCVSGGKWWPGKYRSPGPIKFYY